jgi:hypothetical protein
MSGGFLARFAAVVVCLVAVLTVVMFVLGVGSGFTRGAFVVALASACALIHRHDRVGGE